MPAFLNVNHLAEIDDPDMVVTMSIMHILSHDIAAAPIFMGIGDIFVWEGAEYETKKKLEAFWPDVPRV